MRIERISVYQVDIPMQPFRISNERILDKLDETIVKIETDTGLVGWGDSVPWGANFVAAFPAGARAGMEELAPQLIGQDPRMVGAINEHMDQVMTGQPYVKVALDMACWDILSRSLGQPLYMLLGGMQNPSPRAVGSVPSVFDETFETAIARHRSHGTRTFSTKAFGDPAKDIEFFRGLKDKLRPGEAIKVDVNGGWRVDQAIRVLRAVPDLDLYVEQPCATYEECREVRRTTGVPLLLDETATTVADILRAREDGVLDALNLKLGKVGGIWKMRLIRDLLVQLKVPMEIQDSSFSHISCAALSHVAHSMPERSLISVVYPKGLLKETIIGGCTVVDGRVNASPDIGLGFEPIPDVLGGPVAVYD